MSNSITHTMLSTVKLSKFASSPPSKEAVIALRAESHKLLDFLASKVVPKSLQPPILVIFLSLLYYPLRFQYLVSLHSARCTKVERTILEYPKTKVCCCARNNVQALLSVRSQIKLGPFLILRKHTALQQLA